MQLPQPGQQFEGTYELTEVLGEGGFAVVFGATELGIAQRRVAIKIIRPDERGRYPNDVEARFVREVKIQSQLRSPHSVTLLQHGKTDSGLLYLVSEYVPGLDLDEFMYAHRLTADEVVEILRQVLGALHEAHTAGLLHRDLKPKNIRVDQPGGRIAVKLLDFGLARSAFGVPSAKLTKTGELLGTPRYMSPEQLMDEPLTAASDIYSLGIVAYEMLSGGQMHGPRWADQLDRLDSGHVFSVEALEQIGPALNRIVQRMSARRRRERFQSAAQVLEALDELEDGQTLPERTRPSGDELAALQRAVTADVEYKQAPAPRSISIAVMIGALVAMAFAVGTLFLSSAEKPQAPPPLPQPVARVAPTPARTPPPEPEPEKMDLGQVAPPTSSPGCGREAPFVGTAELDRMEGLNRTSWTVHVPRKYDPDRPHPLIVVFHPDLSSPTRIIVQTGLDRIAEEHEVVVLAPRDRSLAAWMSDESQLHVRQRIVDTANELCLDRRRIYLVGHGVGGYAVERLSCESWVAGAVTNSFRRQDMPFCAPANPVPFLHFAPMTSRRIPVEGGTGCHQLATKPSLADFEEVWRTRNGCSNEKVEWTRRDDDVCWAWSCTKPVVSCHLQQGHGWAGSGFMEPTFPGQCEDDPPGDFPATDVMWKFLQDKALSDEATPAW